MLLSIRLWLGERLFGFVGSRDLPAGVRVSPKHMVKWQCEQPELEGMLYATANTTIPIPKVYRVHQLRGKLAIEMEFIKGCETLQICWRQLSSQQKHDLVAEVGGYIKQLRELKPSNAYRISSTNGGPCRDVRLGTVKLFGPFESTTGFHKCVRGGIGAEAGRKTFGDKVMRIHEQEYTTRFTHGDLGVQNILIRDGKVAAVLDWECAGWYPEYWEYAKAHYNRVYLPEFYEMLAQVVDRYDDELEAERELWRVLDQPLDGVNVPA